MKNNKIIFYTQLYYPDITTTAIIMRDLVEDLASYGYKIKVNCAQPTYINKKSCPKNEVQRKVKIKRVRTFRFNKNKKFWKNLKWD